MAKIKALTGKVSDFSGIVLKAAARGDAKAVRYYLKRNSDWLHQEGPHGRTLLWEATYKNRIALVKELISLGANVSPSGCYYTPMLVELSALAVARLKGFNELAVVLKDAGAKDDFYATCHRGDLKKVKSQLKKKKSLLHTPSRPNQTHPRAGFHPVHYAVAGGQLETLQYLISKGAEFVEDLEFLFDWCDWNKTPNIKKFLKSNAKDSGLKPKRKTAKKRGVKAVDQPNWLGFPALVDACRGNHNATDDVNRVQTLLDRGANINIRDYKQKTSLHRAAQAGFLHITRLLLDNGGDLEAADETGATPIFEAAHHGRTETIQLLIKRGADIHHQDNRGETVLFMAAKGKSLECFEVLLKAGTDVKVTNNRGNSVVDFLKANSSRFPSRRAMLIKLLNRSRPKPKK